MSTSEGAASMGEIIENGQDLQNSPSKSNQDGAALKYQRVLQRLLDGPLHRFAAEKFPVSDHCLPSTISELRKRGVDFKVKMVRLPGYAGLGANVAEYTLAAESRNRALELIGDKR
jgi:hypothetical protein